MGHLVALVLAYSSKKNLYIVANILKPKEENQTEDGMYNVVYSSPAHEGKDAFQWPCDDP